jgi:hypothetical protein
VSRRVLLGSVLCRAPFLEVAQIRPIDKLDLNAVGFTDNADVAEPRSCWLRRARLRRHTLDRERLEGLVDIVHPRGEVTIDRVGRVGGRAV